LWLVELVRVLKPGGFLFLWNLPKWSLTLGARLAAQLTHWIAVDMKYSLAISGRLYPSHYSLLYFVKGKKAAIFHPDRLPTPCWRHCGGELRDYGSYKNKMNPKGVNLSDVWSDISPVRHAKYKKRAANARGRRMRSHAHQGRIGSGKAQCHRGDAPTEAGGCRRTCSRGTEPYVETRNLRLDLQSDARQTLVPQ
jgi:hypothetical protein